MKTVVLHVDGMMSVCDGLGVEKRLLRHPGVHSVEANYLSATATVTYDEQRVTIAQLKRLVSECGYYCAGECFPEHVCKRDDARDGEVVHAATR